MIEIIAQRITTTLQKRGIINDNLDIYYFGFKLLIPYIVECFIVLLIATVNGNLLYALTYTVLFTKTRSITGGYHSSTYLGCILTYILIYLLSRLFVVYIPFNFQLVLYSVSAFFLYIITPVIHPNKENNPPNVAEMKVKLLKLLSLEIMFLLIFVHLFKEVSQAIISTIVIVFILAFVQVLINIGRRAKHEKIC